MLNNTNIVNPNIQDEFFDSMISGERDPLLEVLKRSKQYDVIIKSSNKRELIDINNHELIDFASCNYISFDQEQEALLEGGIASAKKYGMHTSRARLMGYHELFSILEEKLTDFVGVEDTLIFPNTTLASIGIIPALIRESDLIVMDKSAHATMYQAAQMARDKGALLKSYPQDDFTKLEDILKTHQNAKRKIICVDGVYSMTGDFADLATLVPLAEKYNALVYVDDGHGFGTIGEQPTQDMPYGHKGNGIVNLRGLDYDNIMYAAGTAKGLASAAAFVSVTPKMKKFLLAYAKPLDYTHPSTPFTLGVLNSALDYVKIVGEQRREKLYQLTRHLIIGLRKMGFYVMNNSYFPIVSVWAGDTEKLISASQQLYEEGIFLTSCPYPTMPKNKEALRITVTSNHEMTHIEKLLQAFQRIQQIWQIENIPFAPEGMTPYAN